MMMILMMLMMIMLYRKVDFRWHPWWWNIHDDPCVKQSEPVIAKFGFYFQKTISDHFLYIFPIQY